MLTDWLKLVASAVTVTRVTKTSDGMGGYTSTSATVGLPRAALWSAGQSKNLLSDKMALLSTHTLVTLPDDYTFSELDSYVTYAGNQYKIVGPTDNVMFLGEIAVTPLERVV